MKTLKLIITYTNKDSALKTIESEFVADYTASEIDQFIIETIMKIENPDLTSIYPSLVDIEWGAERPRAKTHKEITELYGLSKISYEIDGLTSTIKT